MNKKLPLYASIISILLGTAVLASCGKNATMVMAQEDSEVPDDAGSRCTGMYGPYVGWSDFQRRSNDECSPHNTKNEYVGLFGIFDEAMKNTYYQSPGDKTPKSISSDFDKELLVLGAMKAFSEKDPRSITPGECQEVIRESLAVFRGKEYAEGMTTCYERVEDLTSTKIELGKAFNTKEHSFGQCQEEKSELSDTLTRQRKEKELLVLEVEELTVDKAELQGELNDRINEFNQCREEKSELSKNIAAQSATLQRTNDALSEKELKLAGCMTRLEDPQVPSHPAPALLWGYPAEYVAMAGVGTSGVLLGALGWKSWAYKKALKEKEKKYELLEREKWTLEGQLSVHTGSRGSKKQM